VFFADDLGHSAEIQALHSRIDELLFYDDKSRLVILTRGLLLVQLQVVCRLQLSVVVYC
jgi:intraflagellar transport protein 140